MFDLSQNWQVLKNLALIRAVPDNLRFIRLQKG
jgi:hypothetical protein